MIDDSEIVEKVKAGKRQLFSQLVGRHQRGLLRLCLRFTRNHSLAEDIVQEAFIKAYRKISSFEGRSTFRSWLYQIAVNTAKNSLRKKKRESVSIESVQILVEGRSHSLLEYKDLKDLVRSYIDCLPEKQRTALVLRIFEDLSFKEIADIMNCPYDTAKANYRHAIMKLRHKLVEGHLLEEWRETSFELNRQVRFAKVEQ